MPLTVKVGRSAALLVADSTTLSPAEETLEAASSAASAASARATAAQPKANRAVVTRIVSFARVQVAGDMNKRSVVRNCQVSSRMERGKREAGI